MGKLAKTGAPLDLHAIVPPASGTVNRTVIRTVNRTPGASPAMPVDPFISPPAIIGTLGLSGTQLLLVGKALSVGANQPKVTYTGASM